MMDKIYDRSAQDVGNILGLEHITVQVPNQELAQVFYLVGMGFTRDPYLMVGPDKMWINVGQQQFHLPTSSPQVFPGPIGLVVPDLNALEKRLTSIRDSLTGTKFNFSKDDGCILVTCPWGNKFRVHKPATEYGNLTLGIPYVEFPVRSGTVNGITKFYKEVLHAPCTLPPALKEATVHVKIGQKQRLIFVESADEIPEFDGHHFAIYITNFSGPHTFLKKHGLITEETNEYQYRFQDIINPDTGHKLFTVEHEVRCMTHPMFGRTFINRNPAQSTIDYVRGHDSIGSI